MKAIDFELRGEHITLDNLLKATGLAGSGGAAKAMVAQGLVQVDGREELRKTCKIRVGQVVQVHGTRIRVRAPQEPLPLPDSGRGPG
jgi:ribosome-associated protein